MVPSLARRARLRWDPSRDCHVLLYPEGVLVLTPEAAEVLERVDGVRALGAIVDEIAGEHPEAPREVIERDVRELIERLGTRGFVTMGASP